MKINSISYTYIPKNISFKQKEISLNTLKEPKVLAAGSIALAGLAASGAVIVKKNTQNKYLKTLAKDLSLELKKEIKISDLKSIMTKEDFFKAAKSLKEENYIASKENIKNGIFMADFHSHSIYSDGKSSVKNILDQAAKYGDKLNKINGHKFLFALSDHDGIEGVKEAIKIIALNPTKYKNVRFIPAAELSMPIHCEYGSAKNNKMHQEVEMVEMLIYGINPFSKNSDSYFKNLYNYRKEGVQKSLQYAKEKIQDVNFSEKEYNKFFLQNKTPYCMLNQHWKIFEYLNLKTQITKIAKNENKNPEELYQKIMPQLKEYGAFNTISLYKYLQKQGKNISGEIYLEEVKNLTKEICPHFNGPDLYAPYESSFDNIVKYAEKENAVLGFAHPGFTVQNMTRENAAKQIKRYIEHSNGRLIYSENFHQAYPENNISKEEINYTNKIMEDAGLTSIGGRDMHKDNFKF